MKASFVPKRRIGKPDCPRNFVLRDSPRAASVPAALRAGRLRA
jgi:hypothetical protein